MSRYPWPDRAHPDLVKTFEEVRQQAALGGVRIAPYFGYRDEDQQTALYAQGRMPLGTTNALRAKAGMAPVTEEENQRIVTKARYGESAHTVDPACAVDWCVLDAGGRAVWWEGTDLDQDGRRDYEEVGLLGEAAGLVWGGRFKFRDWGHFEMPRGKWS